MFAVQNSVLLPQQNAYRAYGNTLELFYSHVPEICLHGAAGTGKSRGCLEKQHLLATKYDNSRHLILRKTRVSLQQTAQVTYEHKVLPANWLNRRIHFKHDKQEYQYPNGSIIAVGGLDNPTKIMSSEWDTVYIQELIELSLAEYEAVTSRLRNGAMPYQQVLSDTNPSHEKHWILERARQGYLTMLASRHEDNPSVTAEYMAVLDRLTGVRYKRLRLGLWVSAENQVYDAFDPYIHMTQRIQLPKNYDHIWGVDFGYNNPFVWQNWIVTPDNVMILYQEIYMSGDLIENHARKIKQVTQNQPPPIAIICDHDLEGRMTLEKYLGMGTKAANKSVQEGIQAVQARLAVDTNKKAKLYFMYDTLVETDKKLSDKKLPVSTAEEISGYTWKLADKDKTKDEPIKENDHGMDTMRYVVMYRDGLGASKGVYF